MITKEEKKIEDEFGYIQQVEKFAAQKRLDLNDLIKRKKQETAKDKKTSLLILSGVVSVAIVFIVLLSL
tara:strand:- start:9 stop:215 length:207 start_codon:yes stop_codon:yes gene_type:complete